MKFEGELNPTPATSKQCGGAWLMLSRILGHFSVLATLSEMIKNQEMVLFNKMRQ